MIRWTVFVLLENGSKTFVEGSPWMRHLPAGACDVPRSSATQALSPDTGSRVLQEPLVQS